MRNDMVFGGLLSFRSIAMLGALNKNCLSPAYLNSLRASCFAFPPRNSSKARVRLSSTIRSCAFVFALSCSASKRLAKASLTFFDWFKYNAHSASTVLIPVPCLSTVVIISQYPFLKLLTAAMLIFLPAKIALKVASDHPLYTRSKRWCRGRLKRGRSGTFGRVWGLLLGLGPWQTGAW